MFDRRDPLIALAVFAAALWVNAAAVPTTQFHRDEARWIARAQFVPHLADPLGAYWANSELMWAQPPLGSYLMGLGLLAQGLDDQTNDLYNFHYSDAWNARHGAMPDEMDLAAARQTNSLVGALLAATVYLVARGLSNRVGGLAAALLLVPHPLSIYLSSLAGSDALVSLLVALAALLAMLLAERPTWPRAIGLGVVLGLGTAAKLSPLFLSIPLAALGLALLWQSRRRCEPGAARRMALGWRLLPLPFLAFATFVAVSPYLWPNPIGRTAILLSVRAQEMQNQGTIWTDLNVLGPVAAVGRIGAWLGNTHSTTGWLATQVAARVGIDWHPPGIDLLLALVGAELLAVLAVRQGLTGPATLAAAVLGGEVALIVLGMRVDYERYLLPVLVAAAVCVGLVAGGAWSVARGWLARRRASPRGSAAAMAAMPEIELDREPEPELPPRVARV